MSEELAQLNSVVSSLASEVARLRGAVLDGRGEDGTFHAASCWTRERVLLSARVRPRTIRGVYFLIKDQEVIYVGRSENVYHRLVQHSRDVDKDFDSYAVIEYDQPGLDRLETEYIAKFNPPLNGKLGRKKRA